MYFVFFRIPLSLCFIDFGLGFSDTSAESKAVDLYVLERALVSIL
jgi:tRNA A-37 threonylcarbamoyl transferase component Bud32